MIQIRRATTNDVSALLPLVADYWAFEGILGFDLPSVSAQLTRLLEEPRLGLGWIALVDDVPVGYLLGVYVFSLEHLGLTAEIDEFFVSPPQRGHGLGVEMLKAAELEFMNAGCTNVSLQLSRHNDSARAFYHRHGYRERSGYELLDKMLIEDFDQTRCTEDPMHLRAAGKAAKIVP
jgi:GNAT superfamily N-acetyltransferase